VVVEACGGFAAHGRSASETVMTASAGSSATTRGDRDRLLTMLAERAYQYRPERPFTLSSGALSDYYLDARIVTRDPAAKPLIGALGFARARPFTGRRQAKPHGVARAIEGSIRPEDRVAIVDDVVTTGTSTLDAIDRCQEAGYTVTAVVILVDREEGGLARIRSAVPGVPCSALFTRA